MSVVTCRIQARIRRVCGPLRWAAAVLLLVSPAVWGAAVQIDVRADMVSLGIGSVNAVGDGKADDGACIQAAIDYAAKNGGGRVVLPLGVYRVKDIKLPAGVCLVGAGPQKTIFRAADTCKVMIQVGGGELLDFAIYGTPSEDDSGENWKVGTKGLGEGSSPQGTSLDQRLRAVGEIAETETAGGPPFNRFNALEKQPEHAGVVPDLSGPPLHPGR